MAKILFCPFSRLLRNGKTNAKNYPWWGEVVHELSKNHVVTQIGSPGEPEIEGVSRAYLGFPLESVKKMVKDHHMILSVDNFLPHFANLYDKGGVVIFGRSDPNIFGYDHNVNILLNREYLRKDQFQIWEIVEYSDRIWPSSDFVVKEVGGYLSRLTS